MALRNAFGLLSTEAKQDTLITGVGAQADAEATGNGSLIALLKRLRTLLSGGFPAALGGAGGLKVEQQGNITVGNFPASQAVTGPITDAQLRAAAVPVSGPVTDAQMRASAVPVSNSATPNLVGTWAYHAGISGTEVIPAGQRVIGIAAHATVAGNLSINGGDSVPIPAQSGIAIQPVGQLVAPTLVFTGTDSYFVETLA